MTSHIPALGDLEPAAALLRSSANLQRPTILRRLRDGDPAVFLRPSEVAVSTGVDDLP